MAIPYIDFHIHIGSIIVLPGHFKKIKRFDPYHHIIESNGSKTALEFETPQGCCVRWFQGDTPVQRYFVMFDADDNIIAGASVEYCTHTNLLGALIKDDNGNLSRPLEFSPDKSEMNRIIAILSFDPTPHTK